MTVPLAILATLALMLAAMAPVLAAPGGTSGSRPVLADHVDPADCDEITTNAEGDIIVNGTALTDVQLGLLDADLSAALRLAADASVSADAFVEVCVDVVVGEADALDINADITVCSVDITVNGDGTVDLGDVTVDAELLDVDLLAVLDLAANADAEADAEACVIVTVTDNETTTDVEVDAFVTLCATLRIDANGDAFINGEASEADVDQFINNSTVADADFSADVETGIEITATLEADGDIFVNLTAVDREGCGEAAATATPAPSATPTPDDGTGAGGTGTVMVMKHLCDASVQSEADFREVEERSLDNPTTPMDVPSRGSTAETVLTCPVIVQPGDGQTPGTIASGSRTFDFTVEDSEGTTQVLTEDTTFSGDNGFETEVEDFACETTIEYDADRDGTIEDDVCLDFSAYAFGNVVEGEVTVDEIEAPPGARFGTVRLSPPELAPGEDAIGLEFNSDGVITFDSSLDEDEMVTLHVYNFVNVASATPAASELPDAAVDAVGGTGSNGFAILFGIMALASISFLGYRTVAVRRTR
ncbi:MAG: hypothetical protein M3406_08695 [Chloroflexota bacterium]|nr:hypothetical protein [Chloroflexota bacterium]